MKKKIIFSICFLAVSAFTFAQNDNSKKISLSVNVGAAMPLGAWGSKKTDTTQAVANDSTHIENGYAKTGFHFDITAGYLFTNNVGGMILIGGNMNKVDVSTYESVNNIKSPDKVTYKSYYVGEYLIGPFLAIPAGDKLKINIRVMGGLVTANTPAETDSYSTSDNYGTISVTDKATGKSGSGFGYQAAAGVQYNLNDNLGLNLNLGYTGSSVAYKKGMTETYSQTGTGAYSSITGSGTNSYYTNLKRTMSVSIFTITAGVTLSL